MKNTGMAGVTHITPNERAGIKPEVFSGCVDYYPFGMQMPGRHWTADSSDQYRFGFQGMLKDNDMYGAGNQYSTMFRQYDPRLGRWFSIDPKTKTHQSPYVGFANNPIFLVDPLGSDTSFSSNKVKEDFEEARNKMKDEKENLKKRLKNKKSKLEKHKKKKKNAGWFGAKWYHGIKANSIESDISGIKSRLDNVNKVLGVFNDIIESDVIFNYESMDPEKAGKGITNEGYTSGSSGGDNVYIKYNPDDLSTLVHENRHGVGFLRNEIGLSSGMDWSDELNAYKHQRIYNAKGVKELVRGVAKRIYPIDKERRREVGLKDAIEYLYSSGKEPGYNQTWEQTRPKNSPY